MTIRVLTCSTMLMLSAAVAAAQTPATPDYTGTVRNS